MRLRDGHLQAWSGAASLWLVHPAPSLASDWPKLAQLWSLASGGNPADGCDSDSSGVTLATSEPLTSAPVRAEVTSWADALMIGAGAGNGAGMLVSHHRPPGARCQGFTRCGELDGVCCGISSRPRLNFETVSFQSPRHCCIQKIYITIRRTIWGNKFKWKLCPRILQFLATTSVWEKENWDVNFVPTSFPWYCDKMLPIINRMERKLFSSFELLCSCAKT